MIFLINNRLVGKVHSGVRAELEGQVVDLPQPPRFHGPVGYLCVANDGNYWLVESEYDVLAIAAVLPINVLRFCVNTATWYNQATVIPLQSRRPDPGAISPRDVQWPDRIMTARRCSS